MLALWEYFWTEADWTPAPAPSASATAVAVDGGSGGGGFSDRATRRILRSVAPLDFDYWETRERYLRYLVKQSERKLPANEPLEPLEPQQPPIKQLPAAVRNLQQLESQRIAALETARAAVTRAELQRAGLLVAQLTERLRHVEDAILILLLQAAVLASSI